MAAVCDPRSLDQQLKIARSGLAAAAVAVWSRSAVLREYVDVRGARGSEPAVATPLQIEARDTDEDS
jgi:hypothetical protein